MTSVVYYPGYSQVQVHDNFITQTITDVTKSYPAVITTSSDHGYVAGLMVTFFIPTIFGMTELNGQSVQVLSVTDDTLTVNLNTSGFKTFAYPASLPSAYTNPSVIPNGSGPPLDPQPLPYGNQDSFEGTIYNDGVS